MQKKLSIQKNRRSFLLSGLAIAAALPLTGCPVLFVGGVAAGVMTAIDRRSTGAQVDDQAIEIRAKQDIAQALGNAAHVNVTSYNRQVLLTGEVPNANAKAQAEAIAMRVANVRGVVNALAVGPVTTMGNRSNDSYLTGKVKTALADNKIVSASDIKVVTERSVVYLMGIVTVQEAQVAGDVASSVIGVQKVVRVFEIISQEDLARMQSSVEATPVDPTARD